MHKIVETLGLIATVAPMLAVAAALPIGAPSASAVSDTPPVVALACDEPAPPPQAKSPRAARHERGAAGVRRIPPVREVCSAR